MLKSSRGIVEAVDLIQRIRNICKAGGFILTKFVSNKIEVIKSIPEEHCRKNIKIKEIESGEVQKERTLGVYGTSKQIHLDSRYHRKISQQQREVCYLN